MNILRHELKLNKIKLLQTPRPLGINDDIYHEGNISRLTEFDGVFFLFWILANVINGQGAHGLSGRVLDKRPKGRGFEPHRRHCVVVLEQETFILA